MRSPRVQPHRDRRPTRQVVERFRVSENLHSIASMTSGAHLPYDQKSLTALLEVNKIVESPIIAGLRNFPAEALAPERDTDVSFVILNRTPDAIEGVADLAAQIQSDSNCPVVPIHVPLGGSGIPQLALDIALYIATKAGDEGITFRLGIAFEAIRRHFSDKRNKMDRAISITIYDSEGNPHMTIRINENGEIVDDE